MRSKYLKAILKTAILAVTVLLLMAGVSSAQTVNLTASQQTTVLPDGNTVPMWGWTCGTGMAVATGATCTALTYNTTTGLLNSQTGGWQPPLIVVPSVANSGASLTIHLTNSLPVETSIVIIGQAFASTTAANGGLGAPVREAGPRTDGDHSPGIDHTGFACTGMNTPSGCNPNYGNPLPGQTSTTWTTVTSSNFTPPTQGERVRSFVAEVAGVATVGAIPATLDYTWTGLQPGTYLMRTGTYPSIQGPMGLYGVLVVTKVPIAGTPPTPGLAYPVSGSAAGGVTYDADVVALESEIDPRQNKAVAALFPAGVANAGFSETAKWTPACGASANGLTSTGTAPTCYPPAVDYTPLYFLINGLAFSKDNRAASALSIPAAGTTGNVLVRYVNAGSHMHVPTVDGLNMLLVAEDGYVLPDIALALANSQMLTAKSPATTTTPPSGLRLQNEVFQAAGKVFDVIVSPTQTTPGRYDSKAYAIFDRSLALSTNSQRDGGMQAYLDVNDAWAEKLAALNSTPKANPDTYAYAPGVTLTVSDPGKGVIANDVNVYGVQLAPNPVPRGKVTLYPNGTFIYVPSGGGEREGEESEGGGGKRGTDRFGYCANGTTTICTTVTLQVSRTVGTGPVANNDSYTSNVATLLRVGAPGVLGNDVDPNNYPMTAVKREVKREGETKKKTERKRHIAGEGDGGGDGEGDGGGEGGGDGEGGSSGLVVQLNPDGSFTATAPGAGTYTFTYQAKNSQNSLSNIASVTLHFLPASNLSVKVQDANTKAPITDYKWIIEQDLTFQVNPACQQNGPGGAKPMTCPKGVPPTVATNFHTSYMPIIAEGCTGPQSCEKGQTVYDAGTPCTTLPSDKTPAGVPAGCSPTAGQHVLAACDGYGICTVGASQLPMSTPAQVNLTATNPDGSPSAYYISILPGDAQNAFAYGNTKDPSDPSGAGNCAPGGGSPANSPTEPSGITESSACGHTMGGAPIPAPVAEVFAPVTVNLQQAPLKTATVTAFVFEDDFPLNGEPDTGGGVDILATQEAPLGDFQIEIWDDAGGVGDFTGQMTYDMFNMPLTNALNGTIDPSTGLDACPISDTKGVAVGVIIVCPQYESDGITLSPLTGQVVVKNLMQGKFSLIAHPSAAREANGEEWLQTNSLDGGHFLDSFIKVGEPPYFTEFGPGGYHVFFGFANPQIINARLKAICSGMVNPLVPFNPPCNNNLNGQVTNLHQGRSPSEQLYSGAVLPPVPAVGQSPATDCSKSPQLCTGDAGNYAPLSYTNCYAALGDSDGATIAFAKCDPGGNFTFKGIPDGNYGLVIFDQWNDIIVDGSSHAVNLSGGQTLNVTYPSFTWQSHIWSRAYMDVGLKGAPVLLSDGSLDPASSPGLIQVPTRIRQANGKFVNTLFSDVSGSSRFDETFPLFAFYTVESDTTRFRGTGVHVVNDAGGQVDGPAPMGNGNTGPYQGILNSTESFPLPTSPINLRYPGSVYCGPSDAACQSTNFSNTLGNGIKGSKGGPGGSTGRIDPGNVSVEGWQGGVSEFEMLDWGKTPYIAGENGGIRGHVVNATTRPFDDPRMLFQNLWEPLVPNVTINLYQEGTAADGTTSLTLVDTTQTSSFDSWVQGFHTNPTEKDGSGEGGGEGDGMTGGEGDGMTGGEGAGVTSGEGDGVRGGQRGGQRGGEGDREKKRKREREKEGAKIPNMSCTGQDPVNDPFFTYTLAGTRNYLYPNTALPYNSQFKCYDGYHNLNQLQPAPYDGLYQFPSQTCLTPHATFSIPGNPKTYTCATIRNPAKGQTGAAPAILPPGKYVTEVVLPPGWQLNKEEDLNLLIGDQYIAPVTQQFTGLGSIFIVPDQASMDSYNPSYTGPYTTSNPYTQPFNCPTPTTCTLTPNTTNNGKQSTNYGRTSFGNFGPGGLIIQSAPCVGLMRIVPDYLSIAPESGEVAPFAGSLRPLCDRKEVTLDDQMQANAEFFIYTHTPKATTFTGFISDDFSSEFDPASPAFGEKFAIPDVPVSIKDFNGTEISRIYSDQWGTFNGLVYSTWEVDPPNITGYSPNMMVTCMNDPGPISGPHGTMITDPFFNPAYSTFCYENPFMPADTTYLDTPVIPVSAFADGYNPPDCAYPDGTPMIKSVTGDSSGGGAGPWVKLAGNKITITALGDQLVPNNAYSGPAANKAPYNEKFVTRHYGFGDNAKVTIGGIPANCTSGDLSMTCNLPATPLVPLCSATNPTYTGANATARCGEVVITAANGKQSIDTVTVTIGGKAPSYVAGPNAANNAIQTAIDTATSGDLIIVGPGTYNEMLLMWKPVRLQGVGDGSVTINANAHPAGTLLQPWRRKVNCLFGLALNGGFINNDATAKNPITGASAYNPYDPSNTYSASCPFYPSSSVPGVVTTQSMVDPLPGEPTLGWDATLNGNLAELLQEPTLMGAYEGAGITVLGKGLENNNTTACIAETAEGCIALNGSTAVGGDCDSVTPSPFYGSNFLCNPSRIDGMTFTNSSQGGGGIWLHGWNHYTEVSNNHVFGNGGTLTGGITVGQTETLDATLVGAMNSSIAQAFNYVTNVHVHHNSVTSNASFGDELNSNTPAAAGGVTFCTGADYYKFDYNWVCGNLSSGDGGGFDHHGFIYNGTIEHNWFVFNQSINPTLTTYGGGAIVQGAAIDQSNVAGVVTECGSTTDIDCAPGLSDGIGPGLRINANLFQGNTAEEGSGGGLELLHVNGNDVLNNPSNPGNWYQVSVTNNIFANNVAGWNGGGVSLHDAVLVDFRNNTVASNDSTSSAGVEFNSLGAPGANVPPPGCDPTANPSCAGFQITTSNPQPAGLATQRHSANLLAAFTDPSVACPNGHAQCTTFSNPSLHNNIFWQNRSFNITAAPSVLLVPQLSQAVTGACPVANYWDIGVYSDTAPNSHDSGLTLDPEYSVLTSTSGYSNTNIAANPGFVSQYCNGSRPPPEITTQLCKGANGFANAPGCIQPGTVGIQVPAGVPDSLVPPLPAFTLTPTATVDEGSNWINMFYGPLSLSNPTIMSGSPGYGVPLGNYALLPGSPAIGAIPSSVMHPAKDFFDSPRANAAKASRFDIGAVKFQPSAGVPATLSVATPATPDSQSVGLSGTSSTVTTADQEPAVTGALAKDPERGNEAVPASPQVTAALANPPATGPAMTSVPPAPTQTTSIASLDLPSPRPATNYLRNWGIDNVRVQETSSGSLIRFSYRVVDASKARVLNNKRNAPYLVVEKNGAKLEVPTAERVRQLRQPATPKIGREYWMIFGNAGHTAQPGDRVDIVIGTFHANELVVEATQAMVAHKP